MTALYILLALLSLAALLGLAMVAVGAWLALVRHDEAGALAVVVGAIFAACCGGAMYSLAAESPPTCTLRASSLVEVP